MQQFQCVLEYPEASPSCPDRILLAAVLERATRDLTENVPPEETRSAIKWFLRSSLDGDPSRTYLTFSDCIDGLDIPSQDARALLLRALAAREALHFNLPRVQSFCAARRRVTR